MRDFRSGNQLFKQVGSSPWRTFLTLGLVAVMAAAASTALGQVDRDIVGTVDPLAVTTDYDAGDSLYIGGAGGDVTVSTDLSASSVVDVLVGHDGTTGTLGNGVLTINGANAYLHVTGDLTVGDGTRTGLVTITQGTLKVDGTVTKDGGTGTVNLNGGTLEVAAFDGANLTAFASGATLDVSGALTTLATTQDGTTVVLNTGATWTPGGAIAGDVDIEGGTLTMTGAGTLASGSVVTLTTGSYVDDAAIADGVTVNIDGGTATLSAAAARAAATGAINLDGGVLTVDNNGFDATGITMGGGTLEVTGGGALTGFTAEGSSQLNLVNAGTSWTAGTTTDAITGTVLLKDGGKLVANTTTGNGFDASNVQVGGTGGILDFSGQGALTNVDSTTSNLLTLNLGADATWELDGSYALAGLSNGSTAGIDLNGNALMFGGDTTIGGTFVDNSSGAPGMIVAGTGITAPGSGDAATATRTLTLADGMVMGDDTFATVADRDASGDGFVNEIAIGNGSTGVTGTIFSAGTLEFAADPTAAGGEENALFTGNIQDIYSIVVTGDTNAADPVAELVGSVDGLIASDHALTIDGEANGTSDEVETFVLADSSAADELGGALTTLDLDGAGISAAESGLNTAIDQVTAGNIDAAATTMGAGTYHGLDIGGTDKVDVLIEGALAAGAVTIGDGSSLTLQGPYNYVQGVTGTGTGAVNVENDALLYSSENVTGPVGLAGGSMLYVATGKSVTTKGITVADGTATNPNTISGADGAATSVNSDGSLAINGTNTGNADYLALQTLTMGAENLTLTQGGADALNVSVGTYSGTGQITANAGTTLNIDQASALTIGTGKLAGAGTLNLNDVDVTMDGGGAAFTLTGILGANSTNTTFAANAAGDILKGGALQAAGGNWTLTHSGTDLFATGGVDMYSLAGTDAITVNSTADGKITLSGVDTTVTTGGSGLTVTAASSGTNITTINGLTAANGTPLTIDANSKVVIEGTVGLTGDSAIVGTAAATSTAVLNFDGTGIDVGAAAGGIEIATDDLTVSYGELWLTSSATPTVTDGSTIDTSASTGGTMSLDELTLDGGGTGGTFNFDGGGTVAVGGTTTGLTIDEGQATVLDVAAGTTLQVPDITTDGAGADATGLTLQGEGTVQLAGSIDLGATPVVVGAGTGAALNLGTGNTLTTTGGVTLDGTGSVATLQGSGIIDGDVSSNGGVAFRPGNSIGTITADNFSFSDTDVIYMEIADGGQADKLVAATGGTITFGGAAGAGNDTEIQILTDGTFSSAGQQTFTIMAADAGATTYNDSVGAIAATQEGAAADSSVVDGTIIDSVKGGAAGNDLLNGYKITVAAGDVANIKLVESKIDVATGAMTLVVDVQAAAVGAANAWTASENAAFDAAQALGGAGHAEGTAMMGVLSGLSGSARRDAASQLTTIASTSNAVSSFATSAQFGRITAGRADTFRQAVNLQNNGSAADWALAGNDSELTFLGQNCSLGSRQLWFKTFGNWTNQDAVDASGLSAYDANTYGFAVGADSQLAYNFIGGISAGGAWNRLNVKDTGGSNGTNDNFMLDLYGTWFNNAGTYVDAVVGYQYTQYTFDRVAPAFSETAHSSYGGNLIRSGLEIGQEVAGPSCSTITPYYGIEYISLKQDGYTETGAPTIGQVVNANTTTAWLQTMGMTFKKQYISESGVIVEPELDVAWVHDYGDGQISTVGRFAFDTGNTNPIQAIGYSTHKNRARIGTGANFVFHSGLRGFVNYQAEFAKGFGSHTVAGGLSKAF